METRLLIAGEQVAGEGPGLDVENPYTQTTLATVALPSCEQVDAAIGAARPRAAGATHPPSTAASCCTRSPRGCGPARTPWPIS
jgi:acyl-CoA reductase-like NAD-dependent aldehyde dehydrogenase